MSGPGDDVWSRGGGDDFLLDDDSNTSSDSGEENDDGLDLSTLVSQSPAAKAQSTSLNSTLDQLSHEYHLKQLDLSQREDTTVVKTNPFTKAKKLAIERARKASLPPDPVQTPPSTQGPPRRRGNLACAIVDPDKKEPTPPPPVKCAPSPYRRKPKGWTDARGEAIPSTSTAPKGKKGAKAKAGAKNQDEHGDGPSKKKGKTGGRGKAQKDNTSITFQRLPANLSADSPLVQGFQIQRSLPLRSTKPKAAPFPLSGSGFRQHRTVDVDSLVDGTAEQARREMEAQQAQKTKTTPKRAAAVSDYEDPPTMTHASINSNIQDISMASSSDIPYSSPLRRRSDVIPLHAPLPIRARADMSHADRLEQAINSNQELRNFRPNITIYSKKAPPPMPSQDRGWSTLEPSKPTQFTPQATYNRGLWPSHLQTPLPPFKKSRASIARSPSPPTRAHPMSSRLLFKPSPPKSGHHQQMPGYVLATINGLRKFASDEVKSEHFSKEATSLKVGDRLPGWIGPLGARAEPEEDAGDTGQSPFARRLRQERSDIRRHCSIVFAKPPASSWTEAPQTEDPYDVDEDPQAASRRPPSPERDKYRPQRAPVVGQKRQAEDDEDSDEHWGKAYAPRLYRSPTHESTMYEPGSSGQQTPRKKPSTLDILGRFSNTPVKTPQAVQDGSGQAFGRFY